MNSLYQANQAQIALVEAEQNFLHLCDSDGEIKREDIEAAYMAMSQAASQADEAFNAMREEKEIRKWRKRLLLLWLLDY